MSIKPGREEVIPDSQPPALSCQSFSRQAIFSQILISGIPTHSSPRRGSNT